MFAHLHAATDHNKVVLKPKCTVHTCRAKITTTRPENSLQLPGMLADPKDKYQSNKVKPSMHLPGTSNFKRPN